MGAKRRIAFPKWASVAAWACRAIDSNSASVLGSSICTNRRSKGDGVSVG